MSTVSATHLHEALRARGVLISHTVVPPGYDITDDHRDPLVHQVVAASERDQEFSQRLRIVPADQRL